MKILMCVAVGCACAIGSAYPPTASAQDTAPASNVHVDVTVRGIDAARGESRYPVVLVGQPLECAVYLINDRAKDAEAAWRSSLARWRSENENRPILEQAPRPGQENTTPASDANLPSRPPGSVNSALGQWIVGSG